MARSENTTAPQTEKPVSGAVRRSGPDPAKTYHGRPCKHGHTLRWRCNGICVVCKREQNRANNDYFREYRRREYEDHVTYYRKLLTNRRRAALKRKEARHGPLSDEG